MRILILGAGGIGGYLGARLIEARAEPRFLVRPARAEQIRRSGLQLRSPLGDVDCMPKILLAPEEPADLVILACKGQDLPAATEAIAPVIGPGTVILPFLNGLLHLDNLAKRFPMATLWGGVAQIGVTMEAEGTIRHLGQDNRFWIGPMNPAVLAPGQALCALLAKGPVEAELRPDILGDLWAKFVMIGTLAGVTSLCRARIGTILKAPHGADTIRALFAECRNIALHELPAAPQEALQHGLDHLTNPHCDAGSSMMRDLLAGRPTEHDHLLGDLLSRARHHGLATPLLAACHTTLCAQADLRPLQ